MINESINDRKTARILPGLFVLLLIFAGCDLNQFPPDPLPTVPPSVKEDLTLLASLSPYYMSGYSVVEPGVTLTIEPGVKILADWESCRRDDAGTCATLIVSRGAMLQAEGEPDNPIIFTTNHERLGDWGGIVINGNAPCNTGADTEALGETGAYCGSDPDDNSGVLRHVIVEYAGASAIDSSLHHPSSIALHGVGRGTTIEHVHTSKSDWNGFTMVGGTVDLRYALATCISENGFAWHDGWQGRGQFWISQQCNDKADSGIYGANVSPWDADLIAAPRSNPVVYNFTLVGSPDREVGREGIEMTLGTGGLLANGIVYNHLQKGFWINDKETCDYIEDGSIQLRNTYFAANERDFTNRCGENELFLNETAGNVIGTSNFLQNPFSLVTPNFMLTAEGQAFPVDASAASLDWFEPADFIGGMGEEDWVTPLMP